MTRVALGLFLTIVAGVLVFSATMRDVSIPAPPSSTLVTDSSTPQNETPQSDRQQVSRRLLFRGVPARIADLPGSLFLGRFVEPAVLQFHRSSLSDDSTDASQTEAALFFPKDLSYGTLLSLAKEPTAPLTLDLLPGQRITGRVVERHTDRGVPYAYLELLVAGHRLLSQEGAPFLQALAEADGRFAFPPLVMGEYSVTTSWGAEELASDQISILDGPPKFLTVEVDLRDRIRGRVIDDRGRPTPGVSVVARDPSTDGMILLGSTDQKGQFLVVRRPDLGSRLLLGASFGSRTILKGFPTLWGEFAEIRVPAATLTIVAIDEATNDPITSYGVNIVENSDDEKGPLVLTVSTEYEGRHPNGRLTVVGRTCSLIRVVPPENGNSASSEFVQVTDGEIVIRVPRAVTFPVRCLDAGTLSPVANATVSVERKAAAQGISRAPVLLSKSYVKDAVASRFRLVLAAKATDESGTCDVHLSSREGPVIVRVVAPRYSEQRETVVPAIAKQSAAIILLRREARLMVNAYPTIGLPARIGVSAVSLDVPENEAYPRGEWLTTGAPLDKDGRATIAGMPEGRYRLQLRLGNQVAATLIPEVVLISGQDHRVDLDLSDYVTGTLRLQWDVSSNVELAHLEQGTVELYRVGVFGGTATVGWLVGMPEYSTSWVGKPIEVGLLPPGDYRVVVRGTLGLEDRMFLVPEPLRVGPGSTVDRTLVPQCFPVNLEFRGTDGRTLANTKVEVEGVSGLELWETDEDGRIVRSWGPDVPYQVSWNGKKQTVVPQTNKSAVVVVSFQ